MEKTHTHKNTQTHQQRLRKCCHLAGKTVTLHKQIGREREREIDRGGDIERETERPTKKDRESGR